MTEKHSPWKRLLATAATLTLLCAALPRFAHAADEVDTLVEAQRKAQKIPGLSLAVVKDGKVVKSAGYGLARENPAAPATETTVYEIASLTKQFTALAVLILAEDGKVALTDPVGNHLADLPEAWRKVTVQQLLNHTSGIPSYTDLPDFGKDPRKDYAHRELIGLVTAKPMAFAPGTDWAYNNTGYYLLGMLIEKVGGTSYDAFLQKRIFRPLGMADTRLNDRKAAISRRAMGHTVQDGKSREADPVSPTQPFSAGALLSTVVDMAKWDAALDGETLVKKATREKMWTPVTLADGSKRDYGFGWVVDTYRTRRRIHHAGGINGFASYITRFPDDRVTVIVLTNQDAADPGQIGSAVAAEYIPALKANAPKTIPDKDPKTTARLKGVLQALIEGKENPADFTGDFHKFLFPDRVKELRAFLKAQGPLKSFDLIASREEADRRELSYRAVFERVALRCDLVLDTGGKIAGWVTRPE